MTIRHQLSTLIFLFVLASFFVLPQHQVISQADKAWCVSVWYPSSEDPNGYASILNNVDVIHEVNPFWYSPTPDGNLLKDTAAEDPEKMAEWRAAGIAIIPSIASVGLSVMIEDATIREQHIDTIVALVEEMDYDGIDIDYESFTLRTRDPFSLFIEELATELHANGKLLSIAVHAKTSDEGAWESAAAQDWARLAAAVDLFKIMTYDYHNRAGDAGPIGPPEWASEVLAYAATVADLSKVRLGLHFYGYTWQRTTVVRTISWSSIQNWITSFELPIMRDPVDMEARIDLDVQGLPKQTVYFADAEGLAYKLDLILSQYPEIGGVAIWGLGGEDPANWYILRGLAGNCALLKDN